jgi:hypothetical protein
MYRIAPGSRLQNPDTRIGLDLPTIADEAAYSTNLEKGVVEDRETISRRLSDLSV